MLKEFEKRLNAYERVEEILASIMLHESIMSDLLQRSEKQTDRTWKKISYIIENGNARFLTYSRDPNISRPGFCKEFRGATFIFV